MISISGTISWIDIPQSKIQNGMIQSSGQHNGRKKLSSFFEGAKKFSVSFASL
jgi:hypothetical protein